MLGVVHKRAGLAILHVQEFCCDYRPPERFGVYGLEILVRGEVDHGGVGMIGEVRIQPIGDPCTPEIIEGFSAGIGHSGAHLKSIGLDRIHRT